MENRNWKYRITAGYTGTVLSFFMLVLFGGIALLLYLSDNGAFILVSVLAILVFAIFFVSLYNALVKRIYVAEDGFYYRTKITNGRFYNYTEISNAWISSGTNLNGTNSEFFDFECSNGQTYRFALFSDAYEAVEFIIKRVNESASVSVTEDYREYRIDGKRFGISRLVISFVIALSLTAITVPFAGKTVIIWMIVPGAVLSLCVFLFLLNRYLFFEIKIERDGFFYRSGAFNRKYYKYTDICESKMTKKVYRNRRSAFGDARLYYYYFSFTDNYGKTIRFQYEKSLYEREVAVLKKRIDAANGVKRSRAVS